MAELNQSYPFSIMPIKDIDFFKVEVPGGGMVWAEIGTSSIKNPAPRVSVYDENQKLLSRTPFAQVVGPTQVYFSVQDPENDASSPETFDITFKFLEEIDLNEPNNLPFMAVEIDLNTIEQGAIIPAGDIDFYEINVDHPGYLVIDGLEIPEGLEFNFQLCDLKGKPLSKKGFDFRVDKGNYLLKAAAGNRQSSAETYSFKVHWIGDFDELERTGNEAAEVELGNIYTTAFFPKGDIDYWSFELKETNRIGLFHTGEPPGFVQTAEIFDERGEQAFNGRLPCTLEAGKYTLKTRGNQTTPQGFQVSLVKLETKDILEFNDTFEAATVIEVEKAYDIYIDVPNDLDFFKFTLINEKPVSIDCYYQTLKKLGGISAQVFDSELKQIQPDKSPTPRWTKKLSPGEYYLKISADRPHDIPIRMLVRTGSTPNLSGSIAVAVVGLKLNEKEKELTKTLAQSTNSVYIDTNEKTTINEAVEAAVKKVGIKESEKTVDANRFGNSEPVSETDSIKESDNLQKETDMKSTSSPLGTWLVFLLLGILLSALLVWRKRAAQ
ncbi:MAG: hypothetical protein VX768_12610 [Planctomycetota bacterium]|nr:hypothetical protein [Planctomycetota bacterium]